MNRKKFITSGGSALAASLLSTLPVRANDNDEENAVLIPPYLKKGDTIGITSPAGYITLESIQPAIQQMESWGLKVKPGNTIGKRDYTFGGTDRERAEDLQQMLDDPSISAIMCARGGYGSVRLIDQLRWDRFRLSPKWIIGFSDVTVIHSHISRVCGVASIHSKMCNSFPDDWNKAEPIQIETILSIRDVLMGEKMSYSLASNSNNRTGTATGRLIGGNLKTLESLSGSSSDIKTEGKILFVEDTGEYLYSIDRMFWNLKRTGKLDKLAGLIVGGFKIKPDDPGEEFGRNLYDIVLEKVRNYSYPVCFDFPVGHQKNNFALKLNAKHRLTVEKDIAELTEER
jgi:muramoyltetrapeptide carboxypeptidase